MKGDFQRRTGVECMLFMSASFSPMIKNGGGGELKLSHHWHSASPSLGHTTHTPLGGLRVLDGLIHGEDDAGGFGGGRNGVDLDQSGFEHAGVKVVGDAFGFDVDAEIGSD